jgi:ribonuclease HI
MCGFNINLAPTSGDDSFTRYKNPSKKHGSLFFIVLWVVWCVRNVFVYQNQKENTHASVVKIYSLLRSCATVFTPPPSVSTTSANPRFVTYPQPVEGTLSLNVDGSLLGASNTPSYGGLVQDNDSVFILGFYGVAVVQSILFVEFMVVLHGLQLYWENEYRYIICYSDSLLIVNIIRDDISAHHRFTNEVAFIRQLLDRDWDVMVIHTLREGNACADVLAKMVALSTTPLVKISSPPSELNIPLLADAQDVVFTRE